MMRTARVYGGWTGEDGHSSLGAPAVAPLLRHPLRSNAGRHRLQYQEQSAGAAALAVGESPLSARFLHLLERALDHAVGEARHGGL